MSDLIAALTIFLKYSDLRNPTHCEHDELLVVGIPEGLVTSQDRERLEHLGFHWSECYECFASYRFGSA